MNSNSIQPGMRVLAVDPGTETSGVVLCEIQTDVPPVILIHDPHIYNPNLLVAISELALGENFYRTALLLEEVACYGMPVGATTFATVFWSGIIAQHYASHGGDTLAAVKRMQVKMALCHKTAGVKDSNVRQALIDAYGPGKQRAVGVKHNPGPLYGISKDAWQALALAYTAWLTPHNVRSPYDILEATPESMSSNPLADKARREMEDKPIDEGDAND